METPRKVHPALVSNRVIPGPAVSRNLWPDILGRILGPEISPHQTMSVLSKDMRKLPKYPMAIACKTVECPCMRVIPLYLLDTPIYTLLNHMDILYIIYHRLDPILYVYNCIYIYIHLFIYVLPQYMACLIPTLVLVRNPYFFAGEPRHTHVPLDGEPQNHGFSLNLANRLNDLEVSDVRKTQNPISCLLKWSEVPPSLCKIELNELGFQHWKP